MNLFDKISAAKIIVEAGLNDFRIDPSQGTHFFQNLTSFNDVNIEYAASGSGFVDFTFGNSNSYDYFIGTHSTPDSGVIKIEFKKNNY